MAGRAVRDERLPGARFDDDDRDQRCILCRTRVRQRRKGGAAIMNTNFSRRRVLRGMMGGGAVTLALPFLDCFLNTNGTALAGGRPLPVRFGTWNWGLGMNSQRWVPTKLGTDYDLLPELKYIE